MAIKRTLPHGKDWAAPNLRSNRHLLATLMLLRYWLKRIPAASSFAKDWKLRIEKYLQLPDIEQQKLFAGLCHSCDKIERTYRESLVELQLLFNTLSQNAFTGVLDLSRVILPTGFNSLAGDDTRDPKIERIEHAPFELPTPPMPSLEDAYRARELALNQWLEAYVNNLQDQPFSADDFLNLVQQKLSAMEEDLDAEWVSELVGANDYEQVKAWVFKNLKGKKLRQKYDDKKNRVRVSQSKD